jgi:hypothetical protein
MKKQVTVKQNKIESLVMGHKVEPDTKTNWLTVGHKINFKLQTSRRKQCCLKSKKPRNLEQEPGPPG